MLDGKARRGDFSGGDRIAFVRCSESHAASGLQPHRQGKSRRVILLVQKRQERIMSIFFPLKLKNIFCMATNLEVVAICGQGNQGRQFFLRVGRQIK
ncbi:hypothetical protein FQZ97_624530 [compost metagenome]